MRTLVTNMPSSMRRLIVVGTLCAVSAIAAMRAEAATLTYKVDVDTTSIFSGRHGFMELEFLSGGASAKNAVAQFSLLPFDTGLDLSPTLVRGNASGNLQNGVTLGNGSGMNELIQGFTFGKKFSFLLTLTMDGLVPGGALAPFASSFNVLLSRTPNVYTPFLSHDPTNQGRLIAFNIGADGKTSWEGFGPVSVTVQDTPAVPEPTTLMLVGSGVVGLVARYRRRRA